MALTSPRVPQPRLRNLFASEEGTARNSRSFESESFPAVVSGFQYSLNIEEQSREGDFILDEKAFACLLTCLARSINTVAIDYVMALLGSWFYFKNPNATGSCGCGTSSPLNTTQSNLRRCVRTTARAFFISLAPGGNLLAPPSASDTLSRSSRLEVSHILLLQRSWTADFSGYHCRWSNPWNRR